MHGTATASRDAVDAFAELQRICRERLQELIKEGPLYGEPFEYVKRLEYELTTYRKSGYSDLILITRDYISWARSDGVIVGPGRGSAPGSLVVYLSGITTIDPIRFGLLFERFL
ncbi:MAG: hypothetical protein ACXABY_25975, partial [Candidatus Thorarchaeota archaeon]